MAELIRASEKYFLKKHKLFHDKPCVIIAVTAFELKSVLDKAKKVGINEV